MGRVGPGRARDSKERCVAGLREGERTLGARPRKAGGCCCRGGTVARAQRISRRLLDQSHAGCGRKSYGESPLDIPFNDEGFPLADGGGEQGRGGKR